jgi:hypothetical protein
MSESIFSKVKTLLEIDLSDDIFDSELLLYLNTGIRYLINNKIPINLIDESTLSDEWISDGLKSGDENIVIAWLHLYCLQRFDRTLTTEFNSTLKINNWLDAELNNLIYQLKVIYDNTIQAATI